MSKLISVTTNEALRMIENTKEPVVTMCFSEKNAQVKLKNAKSMLLARSESGFGSHTVEIYFKGIKEVQCKKSEAEDKRRLGMEHSVDVLNLAEGLTLGLQSDLEVSVLLSRHNGGTKFIYTVYHASKNETALIFGKVISQEIMKAADQKGILKKVTVFLEENEADDYDPNDEAEQDR